MEVLCTLGKVYTLLYFMKRAKYANTSLCSFDNKNISCRLDTENKSLKCVCMCPLFSVYV